MPSKHDEESQTTLRRKAADLAAHSNPKTWTTKAKVWVAIIAGVASTLAIVVTAVVWFNGENAWAAEVKRADTAILLNLQQINNASRYSQVNGDIAFLEYRQEKNGTLSSTERRRLEALQRELERLETEKESLEKLEIELQKK